MEIVRAESNRFKDPGTIFMVPHYSTWHDMFSWPHLKWIDICTIYDERGRSMVYRFPFSETVKWSGRFSVPLAGRENDGYIAVLDKEDAKVAMAEYKKNMTKLQLTGRR